MYVIFPADELVYLSYDRLIYVPSNQPSAHQAPQITTSCCVQCKSSSGGSAVLNPEQKELPTPPQRIKRAHLISSGQQQQQTSLIDNSSDDHNIQPPKATIRSRKKSKTPTKSREHSPHKSKISPSTSLKSSSNSSTYKVPAPVAAKVSEPDPGRYTNSSNSSSSPAHLQVPAANRSSGCSNRKRLSYSDFLPVHKCLLAVQENNKQLLRPHSSPVDFNWSPSRTIPASSSSVQASNNSFRASKSTHHHHHQHTLDQRDFIPSANLLAELASSSGKQSPSRKGTIFGKTKKASEQLGGHHLSNMAAMGNESALKELTHPNYNEPLKLHNGVTFKLIRTVSDFTQQLAQMYEQHADELQLLVGNFRKRNGELRKERPACPSSLFHAWETLLQEVEIDGQALGDIASILGRQVSRPLLEKSFYRKIQSRKVFTHRESYETIISKTEEKLAKCRQEYKSAYLLYLAAPTTDSLSAYFNCHNAYVQQLHATNGMLDAYNKDTLPQLLQELEEIYGDLCATISESILQGAEVVSARALEQCKRYDGLVGQCRSVNGAGDLTHVARALPVPQGRPPVLRRPFVPPQPPAPTTPDPGGADPSGLDEAAAPTIQHENIPPPLKDELVIDRLSAVQVRPSHDALRKEAADLEAQTRQIQDALDTMLRLQQRSVEAQLFNKANEIQEDISMKRFDLRVAQIHLSAINAQKELFSNKLETGEPGRERKMSNASTGSMKTKWLKAFKSLKTPPPETEKKNGSAAATRELLKGDPDAHNFQEYTYKKITPCDICSQVLRGHTRQGLRCRICKMNVHVYCQDKVGKCQTKAKLLRRQKSTSEIETKIIADTTEEDINEHINSTSRMSTMNRQLSMRDGSTSHDHPPSPLGGGGELSPPHYSHNTVIEASSGPTTSTSQPQQQEVDLIYQVLKQAGEISNTKPGITVDRAPVDPNHQQPSGGSGNLSRRLIGATGVGPPHSPRSGSTLCVVNPAPCATSSDCRSSSGPSGGGAGGSGGTPESSMRRRLFAGMKSLTGFGSRSRHGSPGHRSISLPEKRKSTDASGTRPFGQPLMLLPQLENGDFGYPNDAPHSPRRQKLNLRMKSLSLDSPESTEHAQRRNHQRGGGSGGHGSGSGGGGGGTTSDPHSNQSSSSRIQFSTVCEPARSAHVHASHVARGTLKANSTPSSPVHNRRLLSAKNIRMSSVELPDDNEKSPSSASTSPCPSPVTVNKKSHRLLPTNLYVVLYNFKSRHQDELDLKAGYKVTVIDTSDPDWWKGKCLGRVGYFPSKYCSKLSSGEKPLQVTHNLQVSDGDNGLMLLRDQIVIQIGEELDGMVMIRSGDNRQGVCPVKFLQEV